MEILRYGNLGMRIRVQRFFIFLVSGLLIIITPTAFSKQDNLNQAIKQSSYLQNIGDSGNGIDPGVGRPKTQVLSPNHFEKIDPSNGQLTLDLPSIHLPGTAGLDLQIHFVYDPDLTWIVQHMRTPDLGNYWRLDFGVINHSPLIPTPYDNLHVTIQPTCLGVEQNGLTLDSTLSQVMCVA